MVEFVVGILLGVLVGWLIFAKFPKVGDTIWLLIHGAWAAVTTLWEKISNKRR